MVLNYTDTKVIMLEALIVCTYKDRVALISSWSYLSSAMSSDEHNSESTIVADAQIETPAPKMYVSLPGQD